MHEITTIRILMSHNQTHSYTQRVYQRLHATDRVISSIVQRREKEKKLIYRQTLNICVAENPMSSFHSFSIHLHFSISKIALSTYIYVALTFCSLSLTAFRSM